MSIFVLETHFYYVGNYRDADEAKNFLTLTIRINGKTEFPDFISFVNDKLYITPYQPSSVGKYFVELTVSDTDFTGDGSNILSTTRSFEIEV